MVNFLYTGTISYEKQINVVKFIDNLTKIFGFPEKIFSVEERSIPTTAATNLDIKGFIF